MNILITLVNLVMIIELLVISQILTNAIPVQMALLMSWHHLGHVCVLLATLTVMEAMMYPAQHAIQTEQPAIAMLVTIEIVAKIQTQLPLLIQVQGLVCVSLAFMNNPAISHVNSAILVAMYATVLLKPNVPPATLRATYSQHPQQIHELQLVRQDTMDILITLVNFVMEIELLAVSSVLTNAIAVQMVMRMSPYHLAYVYVVQASLTAVLLEMMSSAAHAMTTAQPAIAA